jgi:hypothetical protein
MTHLIVIVERPDVCSPAAVEAWASFLTAAKAATSRDRKQTLHEGCYLVDRRTHGSTIAAILDAARRAGLRYQALECLSCKVADPDVIRQYDPVA